MNQTQFWPLFGITQSGGSRYENNREMPEPIAMLLALFSSGIISNEDLEKAAKAVEKSRRKHINSARNGTAESL